MENEVVSKKSGTVWKVLGILLAIGAVCFIAVKVYKKFFRKEKPALEEAEDALADEALEESAEEPFEASADAVLTNASELEAEGV